MVNGGGERLNVYLKRLFSMHCCTLEIIQKYNATIAFLHLVGTCVGLQCTIDIQRTVQMLRSQRSVIVQTEAQYRFLFILVLYYIAKLLHEHKRIEDTRREYTNIRYSAETASKRNIVQVNHATVYSSPVRSLLIDTVCLAHAVSWYNRFKWYNIRRPAIDPQQADPTYYENFALSVPLAQGYIDRLGEIWFQMVSVSRHVSFKRAHDSTHWLPHVDIKQPKADIEFGRRKDLTFQWKRALMNNGTQNELDIPLLEFRIAKQTAFICHWSKLLSEMKSHTIPHIGCHMLTSNSQKRSKNQ
ncbi:28S ribosomal protein S15, mitochondrial [Trichinella nelsoni]|uniref:protein-tyrosine-phosphatase n=1 Tax=Trichinella nelsoni TaxID=6336 RepID=A0A0V0RKH8_9BILA|nr:28S ribosomal protein S15, mitochondrial [Trichinella nelsoni]